MEYIFLALILYQLFYYHKNHKQIMATQKELVEQVNGLTGQIQKIGTETRSLITKIDELKEVINNQSEVSPELQAAVDNLQQQVIVVDELVPDPTEPTPSEDGQVIL